MEIPSGNSNEFSGDRSRPCGMELPFLVKSYPGRELWTAERSEGLERSHGGKATQQGQANVARDVLDPGSGRNLSDNTSLVFQWRLVQVGLVDRDGYFDRPRDPDSIGQ